MPHRRGDDNRSGSPGRRRGDGAGRPRRGTAEPAVEGRPLAPPTVAWERLVVAPQGRALTLVTRPELRADAGAETAAGLLAAAVAVAPADRALDLHCGAGLVGATAAMLAPAGWVTLADADLVAVEAARRTLVANGLEQVAVFHSAGTAQLPPADAPYDVATVRLPKGTLPARQLLLDALRALRPGGRCYLAGARNAGIEPAVRGLAALCGGAVTLAYRGGCRVAMATRPAALPDPLPAEYADPWLDHAAYAAYTVSLRGLTLAVRARPGVFSWERLDDGSRLLIEAISVAPGMTVLDLGCGAGAVGAAAAVLVAPGRVYLVDSDIAAVESARRTLAAAGLSNAVALPSDGVEAVRGLTFDLVVSNPPFHAGAATTTATARRFVWEAASVLRPGGRCVIVANQFLAYEREMAAALGGPVETLAADGRYKVLAAVRR